MEQLKKEIKDADCILIGAGAGLSVAAGMTYDGNRFEKNFSDFHKKYGITDMYSGGFYPYDTLEEYWAWWSRHIFINRYAADTGKVYTDLLEIVKNKDYFVLTTNVDHQFQKAGFDKERLFYTQGDYGLFQCARACHDKTYDNREIVYQMVEKQKNMKIPSEFIPKCPICGAPMTTNLRCDEKFVQDDGWYAAASRYHDFLQSHKDQHILLLELGVGCNTPAIIKYPFWQMTAQNHNAVYACINLERDRFPMEIDKQSICINGDIGIVINTLKCG